MKELILEAQDKWAKGIIYIGEEKDNISAARLLSLDFLNDLYDFQNNNVQFKPTLASKIQFRNDIDSALSYFIGNNKNFPEDTGFAIRPWINIEFKNNSINIIDDIGTAMGNYYFTDLNNQEIKVEYTFVYKKIKDKLKIILHHSSIPYENSL